MNWCIKVKGNLNFMSVFFNLLNLFKKQQIQEPVDLSSIKVDIHSHLLPGIDDGAATMDDTIAMLWKFQELGYQKLIMTPHVMTGVYNNTPEIIRTKLEEVKKAASEVGIQLTLECSAEYFLDDIFLENVANGNVIPFNDNHLLFECSFRSESQILTNAIFTMRSNGYQPIIAHFERYLYYHDRPEFAQYLRDLGVYIQVNINSVLGHYGPEVKKQALRLIKDNCVDFVGTDCHRIEHLNLLEKSLKSNSLNALLNCELKNASFL